MTNENGANSQTAEGSWKSLYLVGAMAALIAALVFRRNLGVAEIPLFTGYSLPSTVTGWFTLLHSNTLLGLTFLNVFDIANYALVGLMFLAVYVALRQVNKSYTLIAAALSFLVLGSISFRTLLCQCSPSATNTSAPLQIRKDQRCWQRDRQYLQMATIHLHSIRAQAST